MACWSSSDEWDAADPAGTHESHGHEEGWRALQDQKWYASQ